MTPEVRAWFRQTGRDQELDEDGSKITAQKKKLNANSKAFEEHEFHPTYKAFVTAGHGMYKSFTKQSREAKGKEGATQKEFLYWCRNIRFNSEEVNMALVRLYDEMKKPRSILDSFKDKKWHVSHPFENLII